MPFSHVLITAHSINEIVSRCGFSGATYSASDADAANGVVVSATRPDNANQLTTTITGGAIAAPTGGSSSGTTLPSSAGSGGAGTSATASSPSATTSSVTVSGAGKTLGSFSSFGLIVAALCAVEGMLM